MASNYGIDELEVTKQILKRKIDLEKEKIFTLMYQTEHREELINLKTKLHELDQEYLEKLKLIETNNIQTNYQKIKQFSHFNSIKSHDNDTKHYIRNLMNVIAHSQYNTCMQPINASSPLPSLSDVSIIQKLVFSLIKKDAHIINELYVPLFIFEYLFDFQKDTVSWLLKLYNRNDGGILADEMGLGKTLQMISFVSALFITQKIRYCLIVCPTTIFEQWILEWKKYFPFIRICVLHSKYTSCMYKLINDFLLSYGVLFVSYAGFKSYQKKMKRIKFDYMILDEGHKIKNKDAEVSKAMCSYDCENKIMLTGTPIQNNLKELWAIFDFLNPGKLGTYADFNEEYEEPINEGQYKNATQATIEKAYKRTLLLRNIINPFIIRRLKSGVAGQLPKKTDRVVFCRMTEIQEMLYRNLIESEYSTEVLMGKISSMSGIVTLRRICNHPFLYRRNLDTGDNLISTSTKLLNIDKMLIDWQREGKKVLIFTQMVDTLNLIKKFLQIRNYKYLSMSGKTNLTVRGNYISQFNNDSSIFIFLLTTRVGGLGLNLIGASRIIIYDPDWNPTTDSQAKERAYRYGQTDNVETYRFITMDTIEEKIYEKQMFKDMLSTKILKNPNMYKLFEKNDLNDLFTYFKGDQEERIEEIKETEVQEKQEEDDILNAFIDKVDPEIIMRMKFLRNKEYLNDQEMIEYICMREEHDI